MRAPRVAATTVAAVLLLCTACSSDGTSTPASAAASPAAPRVQQAWVREGVRSVTRPIETHGRLLMYEVRAGGLFLIALDPRSGKTLWEREATDSGITGGVAFSVTAVDDKVFYLRHVERGLAQLVAVDVRHGSERWATTTAPGWLDMPVLCEDDRVHLCAGAFVDGERTLVRVRVDDGRLTRVGAGKQLGRSLGVGLRDTGGSSADVLARTTADGTVAWSRPAAELFGGHDVTSEQGWYFGRTDTLYVGHLGRRQPQQSHESTSHRLGDHVMAGFERATGQPRWAEPDTSYRCSGSIDAHLDPEEAADDAARQPGPFFRCRYTGTVSRVDAERIYSDDMRATIEGFDPATGRTTWSVDVGGVPALAGGEPAPMGLSDGRVVLPTLDGGAIALDLMTGQTEDVAPDLRGWCAIPNDYETDDQVAFNNERVGQDWLVPCRADGQLTQTPLELDGRYGTRFDDLLVWADDQGVRAVRAKS